MIMCQRLQVADRGATRKACFSESRFLSKCTTWCPRLHSLETATNGPHDHQLPLFVSRKITDHSISSLSYKMKIFYIGVSNSSYFGHRIAPMLMPAHQILKNESKPAHELCVEKDLSSYSRFTRDKYYILLLSGRLFCADGSFAPQLWPVHVSVQQDCRRTNKARSEARR